MQSHGWTCRRIWGLLRRFFFSNFPYWNAWQHIPHRGSTREHSVPSVRTQTDPASHGRGCFSTEMQMIHHSGQFRICYFCRMPLWYMRTLSSLQVLPGSIFTPSFIMQVSGLSCNSWTSLTSENGRNDITCALN